MTRRVVIEGRVFVALQDVAACYCVETRVLEEAHELGLLESSRRRGTSILIDTCQLERVARIVQLHVYHGVDLSGIALFLGPDVRD